MAKTKKLNKAAIPAIIISAFRIHKLQSNSTDDLPCGVHNTEG